MDRQGHGWSRALRVLLQAVHSPEYLDAKARDFGAFTLWALLITAVFVLGMIPWTMRSTPRAPGTSSGCA